MCTLQVFYPDADDVTAAAATCDPWHGQVADILSHNDPGQGQGQGSLSGDPEAGEGEQGVQADPYGCGGLWERFLVHWQPNTQVGLCTSYMLLSYSRYHLVAHAVMFVENKLLSSGC